MNSIPPLIRRPLSRNQCSRGHILQTGNCISVQSGSAPIVRVGQPTLPNRALLITDGLHTLESVRASQKLRDSSPKRGE